MTFREKYEAEHPGENLRITCPHYAGYEDSPKCPTESDGSIMTCVHCWDREISEKKEEENKMIYAHIGPDLATVDPKEVRETYKHVEEGKMTVNEMRETLGLPKILDSGNRRQFESGAVRDIQEGKGRCDLLPLDVVATHLCSQTDTDVIVKSIYKFQETSDVSYLYHALAFFEENFDDGKTKNGAIEIASQRRCTMILQVAIHFEEGAKKYGENNWQKGIPVHCYIDSAVRHYLKFLRGDKDEPHDRAFCWNILCAIWTCKHKPELNEYAVKEEK